MGPAETQFLGLAGLGPPVWELTLSFQIPRPYLWQVKLPAQLQFLFTIPRVTLVRSIVALAVALSADGLQFLTGPLGWAFADQAIDLAAMVLTTALLGFHILLLPTFVLEFVPLVQDLPTWTACVLVVIALRKRRQRLPQEKPAVDI